MRLFLALLLMAGFAYAEDPVHFADSKLKAAIEDELWVYDPTPTDMLDLVTLKSNQTFNTQDSGIKDLTGLEYAINLQRLTLRLNLIKDIAPLAPLANLYHLNLSENEIQDISTLSQLTALQSVNLHANRISDLSPLRDLTTITWLDLHWNRLEDLSPLAGLSKLTILILYLNEITDLSPLSGLSGLQELNLGYNQLTDLSPLENMPQIITLSLYSNKLKDISVCASLPRLRVLNAEKNRVEDISSFALRPTLEELRLKDNLIRDVDGLTGLKKLHRLDLRGNPLSDDAYRWDLKTIAQGNPGITLSYDPCTRPPSHVSAGKGAHDKHVYITWYAVPNGPSHISHYRVSRSTSAQGEKVPIGPWQELSPVFYDTTAEPGVQYTYWVQTAISPEGDEAGDYSLPDMGWRLGASPEPLDSTLYVDANAVADANQTGSTASPFDSIQEAIDVADEGDCIKVRPGNYFESINFLGKNLTVTGMDPCEPNTVAFPVILGNDQDVVVHFTQGEDPNCTLEGFVITGGNGAILCEESSPTIRHCLVVGNQSEDLSRVAITCWESQASFEHCTIADNMNTAVLLHDSDVVLANCILWGNQPEEILLSGTSTPWVTHTNTVQPWEGPGNISVDPLFGRTGYWDADPNVVWIHGDYHLQSEAGRWDPESGLWLTDTVTSPCIDAGDPNTPWIRETEPHGSLANIGAYGNTSQASHSH